ncbi:MAG: flagellar biosynthesis protein FlhA, partial [Actinomycetota bacterium]
MKDSRLAQVGFPAIVVLVVTVMVLPLPTGLLDLLIVANISTAVLILLVATNVNRALDFSSFPSLLLIVTLIRIGLNVSTSRAILSTGDAGQVIETFGSFVVGGSIIVGFVIFLIITLVQFVVISNGSSRVAEVGARFTLDALPGKQMAIDADLNAGILTDEEAKARREDVAAEADFYGAMDGASKFVKGDAIAGLVITLVNLIGGLVVGMVQQGMSVNEAVATYSLLTVGDGLVAQIPALLVSISSGLIFDNVNFRTVGGGAGVPVNLISGTLQGRNGTFWPTLPTTPSLDIQG